MKKLLTVLLALSSLSVFAKASYLDSCKILDTQQTIAFFKHESPTNKKIIAHVYNKNKQREYSFEAPLVQESIITNRSTGTIALIQLNIGRSGMIQVDIEREELIATTQKFFFTKAMAINCNESILE